MPEWRNWQTHTTQNRAGNHVGSSPTLGTKKNLTAKLWEFFLQKESGTRKGGCQVQQAQVHDARRLKRSTGVF